jgi:hypothetical protein
MKKMTMLTLGLFFMGALAYSQGSSPVFQDSNTGGMEVPIPKEAKCEKLDPFSHWLSNQWDFDELPEGVMLFSFSGGMEFSDITVLKQELIRSNDIQIIDFGASRVVREGDHGSLYDFNVLYSAGEKVLRPIVSGIFEDPSLAMQAMSNKRNELLGGNTTVLSSDIITLRKLIDYEYPKDYEDYGWLPRFTSQKDFHKLERESCFIYDNSYYYVILYLE